jgi:transmembrane sensor
MGQETRTDERILAEAARWHARLLAEDCADFERARFQRWRAASSRHAQACEAVAALSGRIDRLAALDARLTVMADEAFATGAGGEPCVPVADRARSGRSRRWMVATTLAASIVVAVLGAQLATYFSESVPQVTFASSGERRDVTLGDGSLVHLDVDSEISVQLSSHRRDITLVSGRALFEVAHDSTRPFVVSAGPSHTTALGTRFQVQRDSHQVLVTLTEGSVSVTADPAWHGWSEKLAPGEQISLATDGHVREKRAVDTGAVTSWTRGRLVFRGTSLDAALREINRYGRRKVRLGDPDLADLSVDGNFIAGETDLIVSAFAAALPLRVVEDAGGEIILFRRYDTDGS